MEIILLGLNHRTAPVELREKLAEDSGLAESMPHALRDFPHLQEGLFLSTCNRVEILGVAGDPDQGLQDIQAFWEKERGIIWQHLEPFVYVLRGKEAIRHLFRVASSLDSLVLGEPQILGQIKEAYRQATKFHTSGVILNRLLHRSFSVAKRVRTETGIGSHAVSISFAAVELAKKVFGKLSGKKALLIGAGEMAELAAEHLISQGIARLQVANRTLERAVELAGRFKGIALSMEEIPRALTEVDIVISSTGSPDWVVRETEVRQCMRPRRNRPLFFIDIAVPRDIDPKINELDNAYVLDIDDLKGVVDQNLARREKEAIPAERLVEEEVLKFEQWIKTLEVVPTIVALRQKMDTLRQAELEKTFQSLKDLTPEEKLVIETLTRSLVNKIIHDPILFLKGPGQHHRKDQRVDLARKLFHLDEPSPIK
jgi:glutamyl-tRNA reductase